MILLGIIVAVLNILLGLFVLCRKQGVMSTTYGFFAVSFGGWVLSIFLTLSSTVPEFWGGMAFFFATFGIGFIFLFSLIFPENRKISRRNIILIFSPVLILGIASFTDLMIQSVSVHKGYITGTFGPFMQIYQIFAPLYIFSALFMLLKKYRRGDGLQKLQLKYTLIGVALFIGPAVTTNVILPLWFNIYSLNAVGPLFSIFMVSFITYAIVRHRLLDLRVVIQRGLIYTLLFIVIVGFYLALVSILGYGFQQVTNATILFSAGITTIMGIFTVPAIDRYFRSTTDHIFFKDKYNYSEVIEELGEILNKNLATKEIINKVSETLQSVFKVESVGFVLLPDNTLYSTRSEEQKREDYYSASIIEMLRDKNDVVVHSEIPHIIQEEYMSPKQEHVLQTLYRYGDKKNVEITVPIVFEGALKGALTMSKKLSGDLYTNEDVRLLKTFSYQAGAALEKAYLYEKVQEGARELEHRVEERTKEIQQLQEDSKRTMVEISHGLQTPLTVVRGELEFLRNQMPANHKLKAFEKSIDEISKFIYDLLYLALLETRKDTFKYETINLSAVLNELVSYFDVLAKDKGITLKAYIEPNITIKGDEAKIEEMISNLVSNSVKYMRHAGEKKIEIELRKKGTVLILIIRDTGIGIGTKDLPHIFDRFYRVKGSNQKVRGTGLGLAICEKIAEKHNGIITAQSELGKGSAFTITFNTKEQENT